MVKTFFKTILLLLCFSKTPAIFAIDGVFEDEKGNIHYPTNYEYFPVSKENFILRYGDILFFASTGDEKSCFKAVRIAKNLLAVPFLNEFSPNFKNNIENSFLPAIKKNVGEERFKKMWNEVESIKYIEGKNVVYKNLWCGFQIKFPKNWKILAEGEHTEDEQALLQIESPAILGDDNKVVFPSLAVAVKKVLNGTSVKNYFQFWQSVMEKKGAKFSTISEYKKGLRSVFNVRSSVNAFKGEITCFVENDFGYYLNFTAKPSVWKQSQIQFSEILGSFEIIKQK
ncbi:MAG: hypothetical protein CVU78_05305 [Elusimicrobia bacterium HGW-Elusimicrobia-2]|nr:MAG: hypothetical protein CVU78_05305 [Elusimicrobia bacterium HGW-Elusimicrobia-2]